MSNLTYKDAGVDMKAGDAFAEAVGRMVRKTHSPEVISGVGGFAAAVAPDLTGMESPLLISGTDGVGTKLKLAFTTGIHNTVGIDLVAMCVNDVLTTGARPLFFLDYFATGRLKPEDALKVVEGVAEGCRRAGCALVGGETAELPGFYGDGEYDMAGFSVGVVDRPRLVDGSRCSAGDMLIGLPSSGLHSNGFSLVRGVLERRGLDLDRVYEDFDRPLGSVLLEPTTIYVRPVQELMKDITVKAMAHITGGGLAANVCRVLPGDMRPEMDRTAIPANPVFGFIQGDEVDGEEMWKVFNMGVGYVLVVDAREADQACGILSGAGTDPFVLGRLAAGKGPVRWT
ncbi:MAG: phosphoribosylformylglycinamidine cyclo-ligase [Deltaproteobacteria bacterium]|nr:phosphoribosylformylglycinamidine cyclo-ligase [Deltaproteobacteria bacterium]